MRRKIRSGFSIVLLFVLVLGACATRPYVQKEGSVLKLVEAINNGEAAARELAEAPFIFDGEIILMQNHLTILWTNLHRAGFRMSEASIVRSEPVTENSWREFGDSFDVKTFFEKYLDRDTSLVEIKARSGSYIFLLNRERNGYPLIQGFKGGLLVK